MKVKYVNSLGNNYGITINKTYTVKDKYDFCHTFIYYPDYNDKINKPGYVLADAPFGAERYIYPAECFEVVKDFEVDQSVYDLIDYLKLSQKLNFYRADIGRIVDAKKEWDGNYSDCDVSYVITTFRNITGASYHSALIFKENKWIVSNSVCSGTDAVAESRQIIKCGDLSKTIDWIENIIKTNPNDAKKITELKEKVNKFNNEIATLQNAIKTTQDELSKLGVA